MKVTVTGTGERFPKLATRKNQRPKDVPGLFIGALITGIWNIIILSVEVLNNILGYVNTLEGVI